jgi:hypothetical protein
MYEGLGCALENLVLAAEAKGYTYNLKLMPNPTSKTHVANISLITNTKSNNGSTTTATYSPVPEALSLYNATIKIADHKNRPVTQDILQSLGSLKQTINPEVVLQV